MVDFCWVLAGPLGTRILANLGAEVIRIPPSDDRAFPDFFPPVSSGVRVVQMSIRRLSLAVLFVLALIAPPFSGAHARSLCAPGQPPGLPPGGQPPGPPTGRPPQYPPGQCQLQLSTAAVAAGGSLTAAGSGFTSGSGVSIDLGSMHLSSVAADQTGAFEATVTIPGSTAPGPYQMIATGQDSGGTRVLAEM